MTPSLPYDRSREEIARMVGLGRGKLAVLGVVATLSTLGCIGFGAWAVYVTHQSANRIERHIVRIDPQGAVVGEIKVSDDWQPSDGDWIGFAQRWITDLRFHPLDEGALIKQRRNLRDTAAREIWPRIIEVNQRQDDQLGEAASDIEAIAAKIIGRLENGAVQVNVQWMEKTRIARSKPITWTSVLTLGYKQPKTAAEVGRNPVGIYVLDFQNAQLLEFR